MTKTFDSLPEFEAALTQVQEAAAAYYDADSLHMTDADYDALVGRIQASVDAFGWDDRGVLTEVAAGVSAGGDVVHIVPMLSLQKATEVEELTAFVKRIGNIPTVTEVKLDGLAVSASYINGRLAWVTTRGDGQTGEDVTAQAQGILGLPVVVEGGFDGTVRGEVFMTEADFEVSNVNRVADGSSAPFVNPRNAVAGSLRKAGTVSQMSFAAYDAFGPDIDLPTHTARMATLETLGFTTARSLVSIDSTDDAQTVIAAIESARPTLGFPIDGAVIKADLIADRDRLGAQSRHPRWALAWKYAAEEVHSILRGIDIAVGRTGRVSFTAVIDPVFVAGATVGKATLHNVDFITANRLGIGSDVLVSRANDVIPRVVGLDTAHNKTVTTWTAPADCPQCGQPFDTSEVMWRCYSPECSIVGAVTYFASRDAMDIDGLGETVAEALVNAELVTTIADLYDLTVADLTSLELTDGRLFGAKNAQKVYDGIQKSKTQPFNRVLTGLNIRMTGRSVSRWLASEFHTMTALRAATVAQVATIEKMGPTKAEFVVEGIKARADIIDRLAAAGVNMGSEPTAAAADLPLAGKTYVVSGSVPGYTRTTVQERIEALGGKASGSVSKATTALVTSETDTSKAKKAAELGITVIDPAEFARLLAD